MSSVNEKKSVGINVLRAEMSEFFKEESKTVSKKPRVHTPSNIKQSPYIKVVNFGTGTGKTYGAVDRYIEHQLVMIKSMLNEGKNYSDGGFTNAVFITPTKNQIKLSSHHLKIMNKEGITPLSIFGSSDLQNKNTKLWGGGSVKLTDRMLDYIKLIKKINSLMADVKQRKSEPPRWQREHINLLKRIINNIQSSFNNIDTLERDIAVLPKNDSVRVNLELQLRSASGNHSALLSELVLSVLNNQVKRNKKKIKDEYYDDEDLEEEWLQDKEVNPIKSAYNNRNNVNEDDESTEQMHPLSETAVYEDIFKLALKESNFDEKLAVTTANCYEWSILTATLKKDILRIFAPLNYAAYQPSLLCMTTDKYRMNPTAYRRTYTGRNYWTADEAEDDSSSFAELFGGKHSHNKPILYEEAGFNNENRLKVLSATVFQMRDIEETAYRSKLIQVDKRTLYQKKNINFWVMIDESTEYFTKEFYGDSGSIGRAGVIKSIFPRASITDIFSSVQRKMMELLESPKEAVSSYQQTFAFYKRMCEYLDRYCEVDTDKVFDVYLKKFSAPNILYIDNNDADSIISLVKNAFSVQAKNFFDKQSLQSIYVCERGKQRYLSIERKTPNDMNLHEMYQIILSIIYAAIFFDKGVTFFKDPNNEKLGKMKPKDARRVFATDLGYVREDAYSNKEDAKYRQNASLGHLIASEEKTLSRYKEFLKFEPMADEADIKIDEWFAYVQTKMVFTLEPGASKKFEQSPALEQQQRTYVNIQINLITHHPEIELLKLTVGTKNMVHLMSATGGKMTTFAGQFNTKLIGEYGRPLGVQVFMPAEDLHNNKSYPKISKALQEIRRNSRELSVLDYNKIEDLFNNLPAPKLIDVNPKSPDPAVRRLPSVAFYKQQHQAIIDSFEKSNSNYHKDGKHLVYMETANPTYEHYRLMIFSILRAAVTQKSTLALSLSADAVKITKASIEKCCQEASNQKALKIAIEGQFNYVVFNHSLFGEMELPLLNKWLKEDARKYMTSPRGDMTTEDKIDYLYRQAEKRIISEFSYLADLKSYIPKKLRSESNAIMRLALYDAKIDKLNTDYKSYFIKDMVSENGNERPIFTCLLSYFAIAGTGLNNTIDNKITGKEEDMQCLFLACGPFYTKINETDKDADGRAYQYFFNTFNKTQNIILLQRQIASNPNNEVTVASFDVTASSKESQDHLMFEHAVLKYDILKQLAGRVERADCPDGFVSELIIPTEALVDHAKSAHLLYKFNALGKPTENTLDYYLMSLNSLLILEKGQELISGEKLSDDNRSALKGDTEGCVVELSEFCNNHMRDVTVAARSGDADAAAFSEIYHEAQILFNIKEWVWRLKNSDWIDKQLNGRQLRATIDKMIVDLSKYTGGRGIPVYQTKDGGLTDFYGQISTSRAYQPINICLPNLGDKYHYKKGRVNKDAPSRMESLVTYNNELCNEDSDKYSGPLNKRDDSLILHPVLLHIALGNMGECLFQRFLSEYGGSYTHNTQSRVIERFGYQFFEMFDFWFEVGRKWVCIDVKNHGHNENVFRTKNIFDRDEHKVNKVRDYTRTLTESADKTEDWFANSDDLHILYVNMRVKEGDINPERRQELNINGRKLTIHSHYLNFFKSLRWIAPENRYQNPTNYNKRQWQLTINPKILELLKIQSDSAYQSSFTSDEIINSQDSSEVDAWRSKASREAARKILSENNENMESASNDY